MTGLGMRLTSCLTLDLRSLAAFRITVGLLLIYDLVDRARDLALYYTDLGFLPRGLLTDSYWNSAWWCIHLYHGLPAGQAFLFLVHGASAVALALGWRTRVSSLLCYALTLSLHNRNPLVLDSSDRLFLILLFWGLFLPWGARFSLDQRSLSKEESGGDLVISPGGNGYLFQVVSLYLVAALFKIHPVWLTERTAIFRTLHLHHFTKPLGYWLLQFPELLGWLSLGTIILEGFGPFFLLMGGNGRWRLAGILAFTALHVGIGVTMDLEFFPLVSVAALIGLLPSCVWRDPPDSGELGVRWRWALHPVAQCLAALAIFGTMGWNSYMLVNGGAPPQKVAPLLKWPVKALSAVRLVQFWNLFAPVPRPVDSRYFVEAKLTDGSTVDLLRSGTAISLEPVEYPYLEFRNQRERNFLSALEYSLGLEFRIRFLKTLAFRWNLTHPDRKVRAMKFLSVRLPTRLDGLPSTSQLVELAWAVPRDSDWQGPMNLPLAVPPADVTEGDKPIGSQN